MRVPRPRVRVRRRSGEDGAGATPAPPTQPASKPGATPQDDATAQGRPAATPLGRPDPHERIDGLRAWLAQVDRKLGTRTYIGAALAVLALAAAGVGLYLAITLKQDAATKGDVSSLRDQITGVEQSASQAAQQSAQSLDQRLTTLENEVSRLSTSQTTTKRELQVVQDDIKELRSQTSGSSGTGLGASGAGGSGTGLGAAGGGGASGGGAGP